MLPGARILISTLKNRHHAGLLYLYLDLKLCNYPCKLERANQAGDQSFFSFSFLKTSKAQREVEVISAHWNYLKDVT